MSTTLGFARAIVAASCPPPPRPPLPPQSLRGLASSASTLSPGRTRFAPAEPQLKRDLKAGKMKIETLLTDPPDWVLSAKVFDMILAVPKYGRVKANRILTQCRISPSKTIGGLSARQREELVHMLRR